MKVSLLDLGKYVALTSRTCCTCWMWLSHFRIHAYKGKQLQFKPLYFLEGREGLGLAQSQDLPLSLMDQNALKGKIRISVQWHCYVQEKCGLPDYFDNNSLYLSILICLHTTFISFPKQELNTVSACHQTQEWAPMKKWHSIPVTTKYWTQWQNNS